MSSLQPLPIVLLGCIMVAAWAAGFFAATYEGKWRRRFADERAFYAQYRAQADQIISERARRIAELEEDNALLSELLYESKLSAGRADTNVVASHGEPRVSALNIEPILPDPEAALPGDDGLLVLQGVDAPLARRLHAAGLSNIADIATMSTEHEKAIEAQLGLIPGHIARAQWRLQAALISAGEADPAPATEKVEAV